jgi:hypothetical protein
VSTVFTHEGRQIRTAHRQNIIGIPVVVMLRFIRTDSRDRGTPNPRWLKEFVIGVSRRFKKVSSSIGMGDRLRLHRNSEWPDIIQRVLGDGAPAERNAARELLWTQVTAYVLHGAPLPLGPLNDDEEVRRNIAMKLLARLEKQRCRRLADWLARSLRNPGTSSWWGWIKATVWHIGIDEGRASRLNRAPRSAPFDWMREIPIDPGVLADDSDGHASERLRRLVAETNAEVLVRHVELHQDSMRGVPEDPVEIRRDGERPPPRAPRSHLEPE